MRALVAIAIGSIALLSGCIYTNVNSPLSYRSPTPSDVGGQMGEVVRGEACNQVVLWLFAWGDAGYSAAVDDALKTSGAKMLADVQADSNFFNILGVYQEQCTNVHGRAIR